MLDSNQRAFIYGIDKRQLLYIISKDKNAFNTKWMIDLVQTGQVRPDNERLGEIMNLIAELNDKGYIKQSGLKTKITFKGQLYRLYTHPSLGFYGLLVSIIALLISLVL